MTRAMQSLPSCLVISCTDPPVTCPRTSRNRAVHKSVLFSISKTRHGKPPPNAKRRQRNPGARVLAREVVVCSAHAWARPIEGPRGLIPLNNPPPPYRLVAQPQPPELLVVRVAGIVSGLHSSTRAQRAIIHHRRLPWAAAYPCCRRHPVAGLSQASGAGPVQYSFPNLVLSDIFAARFQPPTPRPIGPPQQFTVTVTAPSPSARRCLAAYNLLASSFSLYNPGSLASAFFCPLNIILCKATCSVLSS